MRYPLDEFWISQGFKPPANPSHAGIDLATIGNASSIELKAPENGAITFVYDTWSDKPTDYFGGNYVKMKGDSGYSYYMGHAASLSVSKGQRVAEGQVMGTVGMTGQADGNHTHFEMYNATGTAVDASKILEKGDNTVTQEEIDKLWKAIDDVNKRIDTLFNGKDGVYVQIDTSNRRIDRLEQAPIEALDLDSLRIVKK